MLDRRRGWLAGMYHWLAAGLGWLVRSYHWRTAGLLPGCCHLARLAHHDLLYQRFLNNNLATRHSLTLHWHLDHLLARHLHQLLASQLDQLASTLSLHLNYLATWNALGWQSRHL